MDMIKEGTETTDMIKDALTTEGINQIKTIGKIIMVTTETATTTKVTRAGIVG
jgi:hypothetical protein